MSTRDFESVLLDDYQADPGAPVAGPRTLAILSRMIPPAGPPHHPAPKRRSPHKPRTLPSNSPLPLPLPCRPPARSVPPRLALTEADIQPQLTRRRLAPPSSAMSAAARPPCNPALQSCPHPQHNLTDLR